jgi:leucyl aminopeptidase (aminopeptidase T)
VVLAPTVQSLSHTASRKAASEAGARIATLPGVTEEMLARVMSADMAELRRRGHAIADALNAGTEARITCDNGSDLRIGLEGRTAIPDAGELTAPAAFGNLPCGEGFISPDDRACEGTLVIDGTMAGVGIPAEPVRMTIEGGRLVAASGPEGRAYMDLLTVHGPEATTIAELGIGTNERAELTGHILEDEKLLGTAHVAFGASEAIGGRIQVPVHLDCVVLRPVVSIDGTAIVRGGELLL